MQADARDESHQRRLTSLSQFFCLSSNQVLKASPLRMCDRMSWSVSLSQRAAFMSLNDAACGLSERPCCAGLLGAFIMCCNLNVCSYYFLRRVTRTYFLPAVKPKFLPLSLHRRWRCFLPPLLLSLSCFAFSLHKFPNCPSFLSTPSFLFKNQLDDIRSILQFSLRVILSECS